MKIKVRCQVCGKAGWVHISKPYQPFRLYQLSDFIEVEEYSDFEVWLCSSCDTEFQAWQEYSTEDYWKPFYRSLFNL